MGPSRFLSGSNLVIQKPVGRPVHCVAIGMLLLQVFVFWHYCIERDNISMVHNGILS